MTRGIWARQYKDKLADYYSRTWAKDSLIHFTTYSNKRYIPERFHVFVADILQDTIEEEQSRIMLFAPPQHGKSELVSIRFPAYWLAKRPDDPVIITSYGSALAHSKAQFAGRLIHSNVFTNVFYDDLVSHDEYLDNPKEYLKKITGSITSAGVGGPITGFGAGLGIIDDPVKNFEQAMSETFREKTWQWWQGTFRTRIWERGAIVIIMTRWHEDDLCGRILNSKSGGRWKIYRFPAIGEEEKEREDINQKLGLSIDTPDPLGRRTGIALCPGRFSKSALMDIKADVGSLVWSAEYQGFPRSYEGNLIKRHWLTLCPGVPADAKRIRYWDKAASAGEGDESVGLLMAYKDGITYIEDVVIGKWGTLDRRKIMLQTAILDAQRYGDISTEKLPNGKVSYKINDPGPKIVIEYEPGSGGKDATIDEARILRGFNVGFDRPTKGLQIRIMISGFIAQAEIGNVRLVSASWTQYCIEQMIGFPNAPHDDIVAAIAGAFKFLTVRTRKVYHGSIKK